MSDILGSHHSDALESVKRLIQLVNGRKIVSANAIYERCQESYPCRGHDGVRLDFDDGKVQEFQCGSVAIGAIQYWVDKNGKSSHFSGYVDDELKEKINKLR